MDGATVRRDTPLLIFSFSGGGDLILSFKLSNDGDVVPMLTQLRPGAKYTITQESYSREN